MHDRRVDGETLTFGNDGGLYLKAMTWWDHGTESVWVQPWGAVIHGPLEGTVLTPIPGEVVRWEAWIADHPDTKVLVDERGDDFGRQVPNDQFVIGVALQDSATAYYFPSARAEGVINHHVGDFPVVVSVDAQDGDIEIYLRTVRSSDDDPTPRTLTFLASSRNLLEDEETGSKWDLQRGVAISGPMRGTVLQKVPYVSSFDWAWRDFYPDSEFWGEEFRVPLPEFFG